MSRGVSARRRLRRVDDVSRIESDKPLGGVQRTIAAVTAWALERKPVRAALQYTERHGPMLADGITYRALFSIFAGLLLGFSIAALWLAGNPIAWAALIDAVDSAIPGLVGENGIVDPDSIRAPVGLSIAGALSLIGLIGAALGAIGSLRTALRVLAGTASDDISFVWVLLRNLALALGIAAAFVVAAGLTFAARLGVREVAEAIGLDGTAASWGIRLLSLLVVFALDVGLIAAVFWLLSGVRASARALWPGALLGGAGLLVLQELSSLFVGGATSNPLLASFASLIALLLWVNLSTQVILYAACYICVGVDEEHDRVHARFSARTLPERRVQQAEKAVAEAAAELRAARDAAASD